MKKVQPKNQAVVPAKPVAAEVLAKVILHGDLRELTPEQKVQYYISVCEAVGLNPSTKPFDYFVLNGKEVLYANKGCAEQLRQIHHISLKVAAREIVGDICVVTTDATDRHGRIDSATGAVNIAGLRGDALANAFMKAETKAKRRVTLSICGLNMLDETEVASIPSAAPIAQEPKPSFVEPKTIAPKPPESPPKDRAHQELGAKIRSAGIQLKMTKEQLLEFIKEETGKDSKDLVYSEMETVLEKLEYEIGRM